AGSRRRGSPGCLATKKRDLPLSTEGSVFDLTHEPRLNHHVEIVSGLLEEESQTLLQQFFRRLRTG
ncbi:MAG TPA: hypothetical protein VLL94_10350, partial [Nitrospiraceae bacterium]|nr:hypothetical protein [Nitrospiraceae bacterium]